MPQGDKNKSSKKKGKVLNIDSILNSALNLIGLGKSEEQLAEESRKKETEERLRLQNEELKRQAEELKKIQEKQKDDEEKEKSNSEKENEKEDEIKEEIDDISIQKAKELEEQEKNNLEQELSQNINENKVSINDTDSEGSNDSDDKGQLVDGKVVRKGNVVETTKVYSNAKKNLGEQNIDDIEELEKEEINKEEQREEIDNNLEASIDEIKKENPINNNPDNNNNSNNNSDLNQDEIKKDNKDEIEKEKEDLLKELDNLEEEALEEHEEVVEDEDSLLANTEDIKKTNEKLDKELGQNEQVIELESEVISENDLEDKLDSIQKAQEVKEDNKEEVKKEDEKKVEEVQETAKEEKKEKKEVPEPFDATKGKLLPRAQKNQLHDMIDVINANNGTKLSTRGIAKHLNNQFKAGVGDNLQEQKETFKQSYKDFMAQVYADMLEKRNAQEPSERQSFEQMTKDFNKFAIQTANMCKANGWMDKDYEIGPNGGLSADSIKAMQKNAIANLPKTSKEYVDGKVANPESKDPAKDIANFGKEIATDLESVKDVKPGEEPSNEAKRVLMKLNALNAAHEARGTAFRLRHPSAYRNEQKIIEEGKKMLESKGYDKDIVDFMVNDKDLSNTDLLAQEREKAEKEIDRLHEKNNREQRDFDNKQELIEKELAKKEKEIKQEIAEKQEENPEKQQEEKEVQNSEKQEEKDLENKQMDKSSKDPKELESKPVPDPSKPGDGPLLPKKETNQLHDMIDAINAKTGSQLSTKGITKHLSNQFKAGRGDTLAEQRETFKHSYKDFMQQSYQKMLENRNKMDPTNRPSMEELTQDFNKYAKQVENVAKANGWMKKDYEIGPNGGLSAESIRKMQKDSVEKASQNTREFFENQLQAKDSKDPDKDIESFQMQYNCELNDLKPMKEGEEPSLEAKNCVAKLQSLDKVHSTRTRGWKMRHPLANKREKEMLKEAQKQLESKGYSKEVIDKMKKDPKSNEKDIIQEGINKDKKDIETNYEKNRKEQREFEENQEKMEHEIQKRIKGIRKQITVPEAEGELKDLKNPEKKSPAINLEVNNQKQKEIQVSANQQK